MLRIIPAVLVLALGFAAAYAADPITVQVNRRVLHTVDPRFSGSNLVALWNPTGDSPGTARAFAHLGLKLLRFPGGVAAQWYDWEKPLDSGWTELTPLRAWRLAETSGAAMIFQTNDATDKTDTNKNTGQPFRFDSSAPHQAGWVKWAADNRVTVAFWEIGNEPEMSAPQDVKGNDQRVYQWYNQKYKDQVSAIRAVDPSARVLGPTSTNEWFWWAQDNLGKFLATHGNKSGTGLADAISLHYYPDAGDASKWPTSRAIPQAWVKRMDFIRTTIAKYDTRDLPVYITEWNFGAGDKDDSAEQLHNALGCADLIGMFLRTRVAGHTHFCLQRIRRNWGVLAVRDDVKPENQPTPTYFALRMTALLGPRVLESTCSADEKHVLSAYATAKDDGSVQVMLINKSDARQQVALKFEDEQIPARPATRHALVGATGRIDDRSILYNDSKDPDVTRDTLPAPAALNLAANPVLDLPPYSLHILLIAPTVANKAR